MCLAFFAVTLGVSLYLVGAAARRAATGNLSKGFADAGTVLAQANEENVSFRQIQAVEWVLKHAQEGGAEFLPLGTGLSRAAAFEGEGADDICIIRLQETGMVQLYAAYTIASENGRKFQTLKQTEFAYVFRNSKRLAHIKFARKRETFSICTDCENWKDRLLNQRLSPAAREDVQRAYAGHIKLVVAERSSYAGRCLEAQVDHSVHDDERQPAALYRIIIIAGSLCLIIDKMTAFTTTVPTMHPMPKAMNAGHRLSVTVTGVIVQGIGSFAFTSMDSQSSGCDLTIEVLYRVLQLLQSMGYRFPGKAYFYGDNHTDIKTPAVLLFLAYLVRIGVFTHAKACFLLVGHSHLDIDQFFSVLSRYLKLKHALAISLARFLAGLRSAFKREEMKPTVVEVDYVRSWTAWLKPSMQALGLERLACSQASGDAQHQYNIYSMADSGVTSVFLTY